MKTERSHEFECARLTNIASGFNVEIFGVQGKNR